MGLLPDATLATLRETTESAMRDTCRITRGSAAGTTDPDTLEIVDTADTVLYEGVCRVRHASTGRGVAVVPGDQVTLRQYEATLPRTVVDVTEGDVLVVTASDDGGLVGRPLYVLAATWSAENLHRRLTLEDRQ